MAKRTTIVLDDRTRGAARELAAHYDCTTSEAIRRAVVQQRDAIVGTQGPDRRRRRQVLERLFVLFEDANPEAEVKRLKAEDAGF